jgi:hypothetical protein
MTNNQRQPIGCILMRRSREHEYTQEGARLEGIVITIDCHELSTDEQLALASSISDALEGRGVALTRDKDVVIDSLLGPAPDLFEVEALVKSFVGRRRDSAHYSVERMGDMLVVHSADPIKGARGRRKAQLPENLMKCPLCAFVSPYEELYNVHLRSHGLGV